MTVSVPKEELHRLVDRLPEQNTGMAREFLLWLAERETPDAEETPKKPKKVAEWPGTSLYRLAGRIQAGPPDLAERHDHYLAQAIEGEGR